MENFGCSATKLQRFRDSTQAAQTRMRTHTHTHTHMAICTRMAMHYVFVLEPVLMLMLATENSNESNDKASLPYDHPSLASLPYDHPFLLHLHQAKETDTIHVCAFCWPRLPYPPTCVSTTESLVFSLHSWNCCVCVCYRLWTSDRISTAEARQRGSLKMDESTRKVMRNPCKMRHPQANMFNMSGLGSRSSWNETPCLAECGCDLRFCFEANILQAYGTYLEDFF